jgi:hypothetical protein
LASRKFDALVERIRLDCGDSINAHSGDKDGAFSSDSLSAVQLAMIESFAGCSLFPFQRKLVLWKRNQQARPPAGFVLSSTMHNAAIVNFAPGSS